MESAAVDSPKVYERGNEPLIPSHRKIERRLAGNGVDSFPARGLAQLVRACDRHRRVMGFESPILHFATDFSNFATGLMMDARQQEANSKKYLFLCGPAVRRKIERWRRNSSDPGNRISTFTSRAKAKFGLRPGLLGASAELAA